jgi:hypothetical protein
MSPVHAFQISRASAIVLAGAGIALLFAGDDLLPRLISGFPSQGAWLGQLLAAAWLGIAALNWLNRGARVGGIYGRPIVLTNIGVYFISAMVLLRIVALPHAPMAVAVAALVASLFAGAYAWLLFRGGP